MKSRIIITDAYSAANQIAPIWIDMGFECIHVRSTKEIPAVYRNSFKSEHFIQDIFIDRDIESLKSLNPKFCLAGIETGVELADRLGATLGVPNNGVTCSNARRDKALMGEMLFKKGVKAARQETFNEFEKAKSWVASVGFPVVLKPLKSAGSDSVRVCHNNSELESAFFSIIGKINKLGGLNERVLIQEYIDGPEFAVNAVSYKGHHYFTHIWKYYKKESEGGAFVYDWEELLQGNGALEQSLFTYVSQVLNALEIDFGPSHTEVRIGPTGPLLVECASRMDGISDVVLDRKIVGQGQIELYANLLTSNDTSVPVTQKAGEWSPYIRKLAASNISLITKYEGRIEAIPGLDQIQMLESYVGAKLRVSVGDYLKQTVDIFSSPGVVFLAHAEQVQILADIESIRSLEDSGFFNLEVDKI